MPKVLITGVAGMIGSHLLDELLVRGYCVIGMDNLSVGKTEHIRHNPDNKRFKFIRADVLDKKAVDRAADGVNIIVHLAAAKKVDESGNAYNILEVNVEGTKNVLEAARKRRTKFIFASTSDVYGMSKDIPFKEEGGLIIGPPTAKRWAYAVSKMYGEQLAFAYYKEFKVPIVIIRYFGAFSPRASFTWSSGHVPLFIDAILSDREIIIHGNGKQTRSMAYVDDVVDGTILAMENPKAVGDIFNIGNDEEVSVIDTAYLIKRIAGKDRIKIKYVPFKKVFGDYSEIIRRVPDLTKAKKILGYRPKVTLREGIKITIAYRAKVLGYHRGIG